METIGFYVIKSRPDETVREVIEGTEVEEGEVK